MSFFVILKINPHEDGIHCGNCKFMIIENFGDSTCGIFDHAFGYGPEAAEPERIEQCLLAEKKVNELASLMIPSNDYYDSLDESEDE